VPTKAPPVDLGGAFYCRTTTKASVHSLRKNRSAQQGNINTTPSRINVRFSASPGISGKVAFSKTLNDAITKPVETRSVVA